MLAVPYTYRTQVVRPKVVNGKKEDVEETVTYFATAYFLPEVLKVKGAVDPEVRRRGIYDTIVYGTKLKLDGNFQPDFAAAGIGVDRIVWEGAQVLFGVADLRGSRVVSPVAINGGKAFPFETAQGVGCEGLALAAKIEGAGDGVKLEFSLEAALQGSERLDFVPVGKVTQVTLNSPWANPSFGGAYLPVKRDVGPGGFTAEWETSHFSRGFGQSWIGRAADSAEMLKKFSAASFGVRFDQPVDGYSMAERAQKYGVLFFVLVFAVFFLFEVTAALRIHPLQYAMVGAALCLFFLAFLALTEFWSTGAAYGTAATACTALIAGYSWSFLKTAGARSSSAAAGCDLWLSLLRAAVAGLRPGGRHGGALRRPRARHVLHAAHQLVFARNERHGGGGGPDMNALIDAGRFQGELAGWALRGFLCAAPSAGFPVVGGFNRPGQLVALSGGLLGCSRLWTACGWKPITPARSAG
ncbi:MAG: cell envelope integrity protein CreD [Lacunisphaera sp.]